jgi:uncharacterized protein (UPF0332 family)
MNDEAAAHLERSRGALRSARTLLQADEVKDSISRAYYATFHAAKAALVLVDDAEAFCDAAETLIDDLSE